MRACFHQQIALGEANEFLQRYRGRTALPVDLELRARFNPTLDKSWFGGLRQIINQITMLSIILTGAALIREREHGTIEHLLVMPVTPFEIMMSKVWSMGLVVLVTAFVSLNLVVRGLLGVPIEASTLDSGTGRFEWVPLRPRRPCAWPARRRKAAMCASVAARRRSASTCRPA